MQENTNLENLIIPDGTSTGLCDSNGQLIRVGDILRKEVTCNNELHGDWALYRVELQGLTPVIRYVSSEKGEILPAGYLGAPLADEYDRKMFTFTTCVERLRPDDQLIVEKIDEV